MFDELDTKQKWFMRILVGLSVIACALIFFVVYKISTEKKPWTLGVTYASVLSKTPEATPIIQIKVNENRNNNGSKVVDIQFNSYTDTEGNSIKGFGVQCVGDWKVWNDSAIGDYFDLFEYRSVKNLEYKKVNQSFVFGNFQFYYTGDNGQSYWLLDDAFAEDYLLFDIDGVIYRMELKEYWYEVSKNPTWWQALWNQDPGSEWKCTRFTWYDVFDFLASSAISNSSTANMSEYPLNMIEISQFVNMQYQDEKGQFHDLPKTSDTWNYFNVPVEYSADGALEATDSLFKMVDGSPTWSHYGNTEVEDYWNAYAQITLTENEMNYLRYDESDLFYITIDENFVKYLNGLTNAEISVVIDIDKINEKVRGIDLTNFKFDCKALIIKSELVSEMEFDIFGKSDIDLNYEFGGEV